MKHCPTCHAEYKGKRYCHRCKMDLKPLLEIEQKARKHYRKARKALDTSNYERMYFHAARACRLYHSPETIKLLACAAVLTCRFEKAHLLYEKLDKQDADSLERKRM